MPGLCLDVSTNQVEGVVVRGRTKSGGVVALSNLPGWEAEVRDQGHGPGFLIRIHTGTSPLSARVERTRPGTRWSEARDLAAQLLAALVHGST